MSKSATAVSTGLGKIAYSIIDEKAGTYGVPKELNDLISFSINPSENSQSLWAGDREFLIDSNIKVEGAFVVPAIPNAALVDLLGYKLSAKGELIYDSKAVRPYVALLIKQNNTNGVEDYITLYKCRVNIMGLQGNTKTENIQFGQKEVGFQVLQEEDGIWMSVMSSDETDFTELNATNFFTTAPTKPTPKVQV